MTFGLAGNFWARSWLRLAGTGPLGRFCSRMAALPEGVFYDRVKLARLTVRGFVSPFASIRHAELRLGRHVLIDDRVLIYRDRGGGPISLDNHVHVYRDSILQTGEGGTIEIGPYTSIQPRCQLSAYNGSIQIGKRVEIAPNCAFYPYSHGLAKNVPISHQPLTTKGGITVGDDAWLGYGVVVLDGLRIGNGAVIGAGSVVSRDIPDGMIAVGNPCRVIKERE